ncbi:hypothetical protein Metfor_0892 [Methanoregula formicica SMSP]|uniref:Uncharacterized protein n=1 Tax=Methanoregula formicica (strain DSM 22288 / NBRC 105244 / SMSP) TaxID=593750 RepID=L0HF51_METFS|nr:hypothetical protein Metfor_0892 [Methanoregula formicica SMSP]
MMNHLAVIGTYLNVGLKLLGKPKNRTVVCYQPSALLDILLDINEVDRMKSFFGRLPVISSLDKESVKYFDVSEGEPYIGYNDHYLVR